jgi:nucleoside-diphosphate-sugar epimerase
VGDTLNLIKDLMKSDVTFITEDQRLRPEKSEVFRLWCDNSLINQLTGFKPEFSIERGLQETINWFSNSKNLVKYKSDIYNT